jgi:hypothetical protein
MEVCVKLICVLSIILITLSTHYVEAQNKNIYYSTQILEADGNPIEAALANFRFTLFDFSLNCTLYIEEYNLINMQNSAGFVTFTLGSGNRVFPRDAARASFNSLFGNNKDSFDCLEKGLTYEPEKWHTRRLAMQYNDGSGWKSMPTINVSTEFLLDTNYNQAVKTQIRITSNFLQGCSIDSLLQFNNASFSCASKMPSGAVANNKAVSRAVLLSKRTASSFYPKKKLASVTINKKAKSSRLKNAQIVVSKTEPLFDQKITAPLPEYKTDYEQFSELRLQIGTGFVRLDSEYLTNSAKAMILSKANEHLKLSWIFFLLENVSVAFDVEKESVVFSESNSFFNQKHNLSGLGIEAKYLWQNLIETTFRYSMKDHLLANSYQAGSISLEKVPVPSYGFGLNLNFLKNRKISLQTGINYDYIGLDDFHSKDQIKSGSKTDLNFRIKQSFKKYDVFVDATYSLTHLETDSNVQQQRQLKSSLGIATSIGKDTK